VKKKAYASLARQNPETLTRSGGPRSRQATTIVDSSTPGLLLGIEVISPVQATVNQAGKTRLSA